MAKYIDLEADANLGTDAILKTGVTENSGLSEKDSPKGTDKEDKE